jgi:Uma2 family endonuclease
VEVSEVKASGADVLSRHPVLRHRLTVAEYHRLGETGILREGDRVELLEGQLINMSPIGPRHALAVDALNELLVTAVVGRARARVRVQNPVDLDDATEAQPDLALVRRPWQGYPHAHPRPGDILLLVEVADSSLATDRGAKLELYARANIPEVWIVDLTTNVVHVHRQPNGDTYASISGIDPSGVLHIEALAGVAIPAASVFG